MASPNPAPSPAPALAPSPAAQVGVVVDWPAARREECTALGIPPEVQPSALCLSGGGVRSAAFSLGVIQALAAAGLLGQFHYLSTVSGGGYIGGWLTRRIAAEAEGARPASLRALEARIAGRAGGCDCAEILRLRRYTSYLAPRPGFASLDLWAGVMLWLRNTLINWLVFTPLLLFVVSLPLAYDQLVRLLAAAAAGPLASAVPGWPAAAAGILGLAALAWAIYGAVLDLPTHQHPWNRQETSTYGPTDRTVFLWVVVPAIVWCLAAPVAVAPLLHPDLDPRPPAPATAGEPARTTMAGHGITVDVTVTAGPRGDAPGAAADGPACRPGPCPAGTVPTVEEGERSRRLRLAVGAVLGASLLAYAAAALRVQLFTYKPGSDQRWLQTKPFLVNAPAWLAASSCSAALLWLGGWLAEGRDPRWISVAGPAWVMLSEVLRSTLYVAFRTQALRGDLDREWLARLNGSKVFVVSAMAAVACVALVVQPLALAGVTSWLSVAAGGAASGTAAAVLGRSAQTAFARRADVTRWIGASGLANVAIVAFAAALVTVAAGGLCALAAWARCRPEFFAARAYVAAPVAGCFDPDAGATADIGALYLLTGLAALLLAHKLADWINLNHFSMHAVYRNRLARAFLGTARPEKDRRPDRYAQFDPSDNIRMADAFVGLGATEPPSRDPPRLLPVVNVALNSTSGPDTARAERKAKSFTITPLRCGSGELPGPGQSPEAPERKRGAFATTAQYAGHARETGPEDRQKGITLATAVTISGAAASPNMGYHSSPLVAFVMTLFNVRLGAWLPNPGAPEATCEFLRRPDPDGLGPFLWDLAGRSSETDRFVYLSDGGHFDNLALYEMLRRRCRLMVVVDAGQDGGYGYADLRIAIQNAGIDLGVRLKFPDALKIGSDALDPFGTVATVVYPAVPGPGEAGARPEIDDPAFAGRREEDGTILYLKPWLPDDCPTELRAFKALKASFPHESTGNQFFKESDFESYRALGAFIAGKALDGYRAGGPEARALRPNETALDRLVALLRR